MRRFAEEEVVIPDDPFAGRRFRCSRQPYTGLWFDQVDSGEWGRCVATGPTQSGKTLTCFVIPLLYHLFEMDETVICGVPDMDMAADKWKLDILPVIERSKFKHLLPSTGGDSRGGRVVDAIRFNNGAVLKFMSGGGADKSRAGFTARVVVIAETDGMDKPGITSRESDKVTQLEARTRAYGSRRKVYMECTVSAERGRTWQEYSNGTKSNIVLPCPCCNAWVSPEREHLTGWQGAESQAAARKLAGFACPSCGSCWDDAQRPIWRWKRTSPSCSAIGRQGCPWWPREVMRRWRIWRSAIWRGRRMRQVWRRWREDGRRRRRNSGRPIARAWRSGRWSCIRRLWRVRRG